MGVDVDVFVGEVTRPDRGGGLAHPQVDDDRDIPLAEELAGPFFVDVVGLASAD